MSPAGDDGFEMPRPDPFDEHAIDALLAGSPGAQDGGLAAFVDDLRTAAGAVPTPSPALAAAIAAGGISTHQPPVAKWRKLQMKIQGFLAGLGVAGKLLLGVGVAAAATTGAGAAGVLPGPVQHAVSKAVGAVTPFSLPDPDHHGAHDGNLAAGDTTTTTLGDATTTTAPSGDHGGKDDGNGGGIVVTPTTEHHGDGEITTTPISPAGNGSQDGNGGKGDNNGDGNGDAATTTTVYNGDGDTNNPESLTIHCERAADPASITCSWSPSTSADHAQYVLLRTGDGHGRVITESPDALHFTDTTVTAGVTYSYRVDSLRADNSVDAHSPLASVECCGETTPTTEHDTTTTTVHHDEPVTTTTLH